ncbi:MAG: hypothetical protein M3X11_12055, partial [Acidobacteriota bacterium]|nr:hypothetical protein [Acidobacteriota bacterium]
MKNLVAKPTTRRMAVLFLCLAALTLTFGAFAAASSRANNHSITSQQASGAAPVSQPRMLANAKLIGAMRKAPLPDNILAAFDFFNLDRTFGAAGNTALAGAMFVAPTLSYNIQPGNTTQLRVLDVGGSDTVNPTAGPANATNIIILSTGCYTGGIAINSTTGIVQLFNAARSAPNTNQTCTITVRASNATAAPNTTDASFTVQVNYPPSFAPQAVTRTAGSGVSNSKIIDNLADDYMGNGALVVRVNGGMSATVNGVTVNNLTRTTNMYFADIEAGCNATTATFTLSVADDRGSMTSSNFTVMVNPNPPPVLVYQTMATMMNPPLINEGQGLVIDTISGPSDNVSPLMSLTLSVGSYTGGATIQNAPGPNYGRVTLTNAAPGGGTATLTVIATDNCGVATAAQIKVKINARPSVAPLGLGIRQGGTLTNVQIASVNDPEDGVPTGMPPISFTPLTNGGVTFSNVMLNMTTGAVTADITASCTAPTSPDALFTLTAKDSNGSVSLGMNNIAVNVEPNQPPILSYPSTVTVAAGAPSTTISPTSGPSDSGGLTSLTITSYSGTCGTLTINNSPLTGNPNLGKLTLTNVPATSMTCAVTIQAVDSCGGMNGTTNATFNITTTAPNISISKTHSQTSVQPGQTAIFQLNFANSGDQDATMATLTEVVPANTTFDAISSSSGWSCPAGSPAGTTCTYTIGNIGAGGAASIFFGVNVINP